MKPTTPAMGTPERNGRVRTGERKVTPRKHTFRPDSHGLAGWVEPERRRPGRANRSPYGPGKKGSSWVHLGSQATRP